MFPYIYMNWCTPLLHLNKFINKRPKGPHNVHLSTMCHLLWWIGQGGNFCSLFGPKNTNLVEDVKILLPVKFRWIVFWISPKNTNLVEDIENLLFVKFRWIPFSRFRGEVKNVSANQRTGRLSCFSDQPEKRKPGRWCWDLASCQLLLNSIQRFQRKSWKCLSKS